jgi:hypothetical protein
VASSFRFLSASAQREALTMIVDYDDLTPSEDHLTLTYQGQDFTGTAVEKDRHGTVIAEVAFREGKKFGLSREWFPNGRVRTEETRNGPLTAQSPAKWSCAKTARSTTRYSCSEPAA